MPASIKGLSCSHCMFFEKIAENFGECHRYAPHPNACEFVPKINAVGAVKTDVHWPKVYDNNWCGQFAARKPDQLSADEGRASALRAQPVQPPAASGNEPKLKLAPEIEAPEPAPKIDIE